MAGHWSRGGHLPALTECEWVDPIPVFVPMTGQIPESGPLSHCGGQVPRKGSSGGQCIHFIKENSISNSDRRESPSVSVHQVVYWFPIMWFKTDVCILWQPRRRQSSSQSFWTNLLCIVPTPCCSVQPQICCCVSYGLPVHHLWQMPENSCHNIKMETLFQSG